MKHKYQVEGMHCASCASIISRRLSKVPGVTSAVASYASSTAEVEMDKHIDVSRLNQEINKLGYTLTNSSQSSEGHHHESDSLTELKDKILISLPMAAISILMMVWEYFLPYPETVMVFFHHLLPVMATYTLFVVGLPYLKSVVRFVRYGAANMDTLVGLGTSTAYLYSFFVSAFEKVLAPYLNVNHLYYDVTIVVIAFITLGKYLEARSKEKTGEAITKLLGLAAKTAIVVRAGKEIEIPVSEVVVGDIVVVKPGGKVPVDGIVVKGETSIDESMLTGESLPIDKVKGDKVIGGTLNKQGAIQLKATVVGDSTVLSQIIQMVEDAQSSRAPIQNLADRISAIFVPAVLVTSVLVSILWVVLGSPTLGLLSFVGILVIACPCALGLATPTAIIVGVGRAASMGILIKNAEVLEKLRDVNFVVLDKTGTLTKGIPSVTQIVNTSNLTDKQVIGLLGTLEKDSEHPLALAVSTYVQGHRITLSSVTSFAAVSGQGIKGKINKQEYLAGSPKFISSLGQHVDEKIVSQFASHGATPIILASNKSILAYVGISDTVKDESKEVIQNLHRLGIKVAMLTGDHKQTAKYIGEKLGIDEIYAEVLPGDKADIIKKIQNRTSRRGGIAMVGDGINDAPALATADVGIAMGTGTDVAIESAGITLLGGNLTRLSRAIKLSRITFRIIKQNLFWAFAYNILGIPIAAGILYPLFGVMLNPGIAGAAMAFSSVSVVTNSLRLKVARI